MQNHSIRVLMDDLRNQEVTIDLAELEEFQRVLDDEEEQINAQPVAVDSRGTQQSNDVVDNLNAADGLDDVPDAETNGVNTAILDERGRDDVDMVESQPVDLLSGRMAFSQNVSQISL